jgi:hypothetical protein
MTIRLAGLHDTGFELSTQGNMAGPAVQRL